ncbi:MAG: fused MFS/spermidine synthase [Candidatus Pacearchaeota archaeon]
MNNKKLILWAFAISGFTALVYEVVWLRPLQLIFGSTIYAFSTILTTFFIGFALGSFIIRNYTDKTENPLKIFALLQLGIGLYGLIILWLFTLLPSIYLSLNVSGLQFIQFFLLFLVIIIPATLFRMIWPVANRAYTHTGKEKWGKDVGMLYSMNSFGSFLGPIAAGFIMIPLLGITLSAMLTASLNLIIAIVIFSQIRKIKKGENDRDGN